MRSSGINGLGYVGVGLMGVGTAVDMGSLEGCETDDCGNTITDIVS